MNTWSANELSMIEAADEMEIAPSRRDGSLREPVTVWVVREGGDLFVRSYRGAEGRWYRGAQVRHEGHIRSGDIDKDVAFVAETDHAANARIDTAYLDKYGRYGAQFVEPMLAEAARATTLRLVPR
jgi:hypothetical protein